MVQKFQHIRKVHKWKQTIYVSSFNLLCAEYGKYINKSEETMYLFIYLLLYASPATKFWPTQGRNM
jgi:hypothetical protein